MTYAEYLADIQGKNVGFLGLGRSNMPLIRMLADAGVRLTVRDKKPEEALGDIAREVKALGASLFTGEEYLSGLSRHDVIYKTPVIRPDLPALLAAAAKGTVITSEMELFFSLCPCKIFAVTGSDGKTTTTTLIYEMLKAAGFRCHLGGNIGRPLIGDIETIGKDDMAVVELSSFQLFTMKHSAHVAVITNLSENHLDWHKDFEEYIEAKKAVFRYQGPEDLLVLNADNAYTAKMTGEACGKVRTFSLLEDAFVHLSGTAIFAGGKKVMERSDIRLPGMHNVANYMTAIAAVYDYVPFDVMKHVAETFPGVEHRIEFVRTYRGASYYNDSIGSSPARTKATLSSFDQKVILIAGGYDKHLSYEALGDIIADKVRALVLVGATAEKIRAAAKDKAPKLPIAMFDAFEQAVTYARDIAHEGDIVVLSPASASFDMFRDFEERGRTFKAIVQSWQ